MNLDQIIAQLSVLISLIAPLMTFFAVIIAYLTLKEMQKQRENSYKPDIIITMPTFYMYPYLNGDVHLPLLWTLINPSGKKESNKNKIFANGYNIGLGPAKQVYLVWNFDKDTFLQEIKEKNKDNILNIEITKNQLIVELSATKKFRLVIKNITKNKIDYILPSKVKTEPTKLDIPESYLNLVSILLFLENFKKINKDINFPPLKMNLTYIDIGKTPLQKEFIFNFKISSLGRNLYGDLTNIQINTEIKQTK